MGAVPSVLVCGVIRDPDSFNRDLDAYLTWRSEGVIDRIVFSGWLDDRHHPLVHRMVGEQIPIVLSHQPVIRGAGNIFHQMKALHYGLQQFGPDDLVLRSRTDKTWLNFSMSKATQRFWSAAPPAPQSPFSRRLIIQQLMPLQPFFFNDMMFLGLVKDLRKLVTFDLWYELEHCLLNPEQIFHLQPHRGTAHATSMFLRVNPGIECNDLDRSRAMYKLLLENELYLRAIYESLSAFEQGYLMGWEEKEKWQGEDLSLYELLEKPLEDGSHYLWMAGASKNLTTNHAQVVSYLLDRPISPIDRRTLRRLGGTALPDERVLGEQATVLVRKFTRAFPDHPNPPRFPFDDGPLHIIPPRPQTVVPN